MKLVIGILVGIALGISMSAPATMSAPVTTVKGWETGADVMSQNPLFRTGYAAGASDMLNVVVDKMVDMITAGTIKGDFAFVYFDQQAQCFNKRSAGRLGQFTDFAETLWRGRTTQAASILLDHACE